MRLPIDPQNPRNFFTSNDVQLMVIWRSLANHKTVAPSKFLQPTIIHMLVMVMNHNICTYMTCLVHASDFSIVRVFYQ